MIIPTAEFDPMFANDGTPFREKMLAYLEHEFAELLHGPARDLLQQKQDSLKTSSDLRVQIASPPEENRFVA